MHGVLVGDHNQRMADGVWKSVPGVRVGLRVEGTGGAWCASWHSAALCRPVSPVPRRGDRDTCSPSYAGLAALQQPSPRTAWESSAAAASPGPACPGTLGLRNKAEAKEQEQLPAAAASPAVPGSGPSSALVPGHSVAGASAK